MLYDLQCNMWRTNTFNLVVIMSQLDCIRNLFIYIFLSVAFCSTFLSGKQHSNIGRCGFGREREVCIMQRRQAQNLLVTQHSCMTTLHISIIGHLLKKKKKKQYIYCNLLYTVLSRKLKYLQRNNDLCGNFLPVSEKGKEWFKLLEDVIAEPL